MGCPFLFVYVVPERKPPELRFFLFRQSTLADSEPGVFVQALFMPFYGKIPERSELGTVSLNSILHVLDMFFLIYLHKQMSS